MNTERDTGGPAFPCAETQFNHDGSVAAEAAQGMTLRQYAAIKLRVPDSGIDWLDQMILASLRDELMSMAVQVELPPELCVKRAYEFADAMIKERQS